jgi:fructose-specific phosphotransferase system IIC component
MEDYFKMKMFFEYIMPIIIIGLIGLVILGCFIYCKIEEFIDNYKHKKDKKR